MLSNLVPSLKPLKLIIFYFLSLLHFLFKLCKPGLMFVHFRPDWILVSIVCCFFFYVLFDFFFFVLCIFNLFSGKFFSVGEARLSRFPSPANVGEINKNYITFFSKPPLQHSWQTICFKFTFHFPFSN